MSVAAALGQPVRSVGNAAFGSRSDQDRSVLLLLSHVGVVRIVVVRLMVVSVVGEMTAV